ncbi:hypothetical protein ONS95_003666 [Cadophora gregata]|uniref:uncharacterized protein n=1 Tax=Cadophora gregata TaxID=51156 RepID=UPI0026DAF9D6|nr:uncharacterized protein ONS95_003666 [Cadophora gregata]KAK0106951.1 hypothetical protein ONS95_003666 [Cadophora gregata]
MMSQENDTQPFIEEVISEAVDDDIGYRIEAKATRKVKIAGGILSQDFGFGKTILVLSIVARNLKKLEDRIQNNPYVKGAIPSKATLVLVPPHLMDQWNGEANKFMNCFFKKSSKIQDVIIIKSFKKLKGLTVQDCNNAKLVIASWDVCNSTGYRKAFAQFAGKVECDDNTPPRAKQQWYKDALKMVESNLEKFMHDPVYTDKNNPGPAQDLLESQFEQSVKEANQHSRFVPSKHVTGSKYVGAETRTALLSEGSQPREKRKRDQQVTSGHFNFAALSERGIDGLDFPLFEFMNWGRIVVDEHTYAKPEHTRIFHCLKGWMTWALSSTPPLDNFHGVEAMASLLGVNLGRDDHTIMKADERERRRASSQPRKSSLFTKRPHHQPGSEQRRARPSFLRSLCAKRFPRFEQYRMRAEYCGC